MVRTFNDPRRASRHERGYGTAWDKLRLRILQRDAGLCQVCAEEGAIAVGNIVDHRINKAAGGTDDEANLRTICKRHHDAKTIGEALAARGITAPARPSAACSAAGLPTDPRHPWAQQQGRGGQISTAPRAGTDPEPPLATCRNGQGGASW